MGAYDGYIAIVAEYNHGPTAALKNAFDSAHTDAPAFFGADTRYGHRIYGGVVVNAVR